MGPNYSLSWIDGGLGWRGRAGAEGTARRAVGSRELAGQGVLRPLVLGTPTLGEGDLTLPLAVCPEEGHRARTHEGRWAGEGWLG